MEAPSEQQLKDWIDDCVDSFSRAADLSLRVEKYEELLYYFGPCSRVIRFANAYCRLIDAGLTEEAVPLARCAFEHSIVIEWTYNMIDGLDRFRVQLDRDRRTHYQNLASWLENEEMSRLIAELPTQQSGKGLSSFMDMLRTLDADDKFLETTYHILSQQVHMTHSAVTSSIAWNDESQLHELVGSTTYSYAYQATYATAVAAMFARWVLADICDDVDELKFLDLRSEELVLPVTLWERIPGAKRHDNRRTGNTRS